VNDIEIKAYGKQVYKNCESKRTELSLLDLYSGCGGMSTGLCLGAQVAGTNLVTASILQLSFFFSLSQQQPSFSYLVFFAEMGC